MYDDTLSLIIPINLFIPLLHTFKKYVFIFLALLSLYCHTSFLLAVVRGGCSSLQCASFSMQWLLLWSKGSKGVGSVDAGVSSCGSWA